MKKFTKLLGIVLIIALVMSMGIGAFADETSQHTITISNTDQYVSHTYEGYQIFKGKLDAGQTKLADIVWGDGVNGSALVAALVAANADSNSPLHGKLSTLTTGTPASGEDPAVPESTAAQVAEALSKFTSTVNENAAAGDIDAVAKIIAETSGVLTSTKVSFTEGTGDNAGKYTTSVTGDGYYFVKDATTNLTDATTKGSDTLSKYLLAVVKDTTIVAKDTGITPDKEILGENNTTVKEGSAAVGDTVTFQVKIKVPNTKKYVDHFIFDMVDKLPAGMTFTGITSVKVGTTDVPFDLYIDGTKVTSFTAPTDPVNAGAPVDAEHDNAPAETTIKLVFTDFKTFAEAVDGRIGSDMVVTYTAVVNKNANFTSTGNENEVYFDYSNDPNHDYDGDQPDDDEPMGETPKDKTKTKLINIEIQKTGDNGSTTALAGAEFEIESTDYNVTLVTGEKFEEAPYTAPTGSGETVLSGTYYKLKDGSYTTTAPTDNTASSYASTTQKYNKVTFSKSVTKPSGETKKVTVITDENGKIKLEGLKPGTYTIKETKAPSGYNLDTNTYTIKINWTYDAKNKTGTFSKDASSSNGVEWDGTNAKATITIDNKSGAVLPSTGGIGTTIFYVVGSIMVVAAGVLLVTKKRMSREG